MKLASPEAAHSAIINLHGSQTMPVSLKNQTAVCHLNFKIRLLPLTVVQFSSKILYFAIRPTTIYANSTVILLFFLYEDDI